VISEHHLRVGRTARLVTLGEPGPSIRHVWLACHGYGQLASRFMRRFEALDDGSRWIIAPEALNRFYVESKPGPHGPESRVGATWMTREDRLTDIDDQVAYLDAVHDWILDRLDRDAVTLNVLGFSQGMSTVVRWAVRTAARIDHLVLWAGSWPPEIEPRPDLLRGARLSIVAGRSDRSVRPDGMKQLVASLETGGLQPRLVQHGGGHDIDADVVRSLETRVPYDT
jgi:predicted esterase